MNPKFCGQLKHSKSSWHTLSLMAYKPLEEDLALKWSDSKSSFKEVNDILDSIDLQIYIKSIKSG